MRKSRIYFSPVSAQFGNVRGFTLIELLVVMGFTVLLSSMLIVYGSAGREQTALEVEKTKMAQVLARAKSLTISTLNRQNVPCGYGVAVNYAINAYVLFRYDIPGDINGEADCVGEIARDGISVNDPAVNGGGYEVLEGFSLPPELVFERPTDGLAFMFFVPPDPTALVFTSAGTPAVEKAVIILKGRSGAGNSGMITVTKSGQITFGNSTAP